MWRSRTVPCPRGTGRPACETVLLHHEQFKIPENLARFAVKAGMGGFVKKMGPAVRAFVDARRTRVDPVRHRPPPLLLMLSPPRALQFLGSAPACANLVRHRAPAACRKAIVVQGSASQIPSVVVLSLRIPEIGAADVFVCVCVSVGSSRQTRRRTG